MQEQPHISVTTAALSASSRLGSGEQRELTSTLAKAKAMRKTEETLEQMSFPSRQNLPTGDCRPTKKSIPKAVQRRTATVILTALKDNSRTAPTQEIKGNAAYDGPIRDQAPSDNGGRETNQNKKYIICVDQKIAPRAAGRARHKPIDRRKPSEMLSSFDAVRVWLCHKDKLTYPGCNRDVIWPMLLSEAVVCVEFRGVVL